MQRATDAAFLCQRAATASRFATVIGSYGWAGKTVESMRDLVIGRVKVEFLEPVMAKGLPRAASSEALDRLAGRSPAKGRQYENGRRSADPLPAEPARPQLVVRPPVAAA